MLASNAHRYLAYHTFASGPQAPPGDPMSSQALALQERGYVLVLDGYVGMPCVTV